MRQFGVNKALTCKFLLIRDSLCQSYQAVTGFATLRIKLIPALLFYSIKFCYIRFELLVATVLNPQPLSLTSNIRRYVAIISLLSRQIDSFSYH